MKKLLVILSVSTLLGLGCAHRNASYMEGGEYEGDYYTEGDFASGSPYGAFDCYSYYPSSSRYYSRFDGSCGYDFLHHGNPYYPYVAPAPSNPQRQKVQALVRSGTPRVVTRPSTTSRSQSSHQSNAHSSRPSSVSHSHSSHR